MLQVEQFGWALEEGRGQICLSPLPSNCFMLSKEPNSTCLQPGADRERKQKKKMEAVDFIGVMEFWGLPSFSLTISFMQ